jgi:hypothetical protein
LVWEIPSLNGTIADKAISYQLSAFTWNRLWTACVKLEEFLGYKFRDKGQDALIREKQEYFQKARLLLERKGLIADS